MPQVIIFYFQNFYRVGFLNYVYFEFWKVGREAKEEKRKREKVILGEQKVRTEESMDIYETFLFPVGLREMRCI